MRLIVGLGNPGKTYEKTRHNVGFVVLDKLREELNSSDWSLSKKFNAETSGCVVKGEKIILAKPMTFMNASGQTVQMIAHFYKITPKEIIVVHDDKDLKLGDVRMQEDKSSAGHNGVQSIIDHIGTQKFTRIRIGISSENEKRMDDTAKFVLSKFGLFERKKVEEIIEKSVGEIKKML
ncbi:aminoacyl-tRNA hydrolase [Patescibacteria group bacterium]|nr:aminoacyl-tRNA hydrolase [Patescibacteria group bacterium]